MLSDNKDTASAPEDEVKLRKPRSAKRNKIVLICLLCVLGAAIIVGAVFGAIALFGKKPYDNTGAFYFSSDLLSEDGGEYTVYGDIKFTVCNYADSLRTSTENIESYNITVKAEGDDITSECNIDKEFASLTKGSKVTGNVIISVPNEYCGNKIDVTVASLPVSIVLKGSFNVLPAWDYEYNDEEGSVYGKLILSATEETTLLVKWDPEKLLADSTNPYVKASDEESECEVTLAAGTSAEIYFFKTDVTKVYDAEDKKFPIEIDKIKTVSSSKDEEDEEENTEQTENTENTEQTEQTDDTAVKEETNE